MDRQFGIRSLSASAAIGIVLLRATDVCAQDNGGVRRWMLEIGPAAEWPLHGERPNYGGSIAAENELIENCLELEFGITALGISGRRELSADLLLKKPFRLSPTVELEAGPDLRSIKHSPAPRGALR